MPERETKGTAVCWDLMPAKKYKQEEETDTYTRKPVTTGSTVIAGENTLLPITIRALCSSPTYSDTPTITRCKGRAAFGTTFCIPHTHNSNTIICTGTFFDITDTNTSKHNTPPHT